MIDAKITLTEEIVLQGFMLHFKHRQRFLRLLPIFGGLLILITVINPAPGRSSKPRAVAGVPAVPHSSLV